MADQSTDDLVNQLLTQTTVSPTPSILGVQAPAQQGQLQSLLGKLKQQQFLQQQNTPTPGQYGFLHDAGKAQFSQAGQLLGNMLQQPGGLSGPPPAAPAPPPFSMQPSPSPDGSAPSGPSVPTPNPGATPQQTIANAVMAAKAYHNSLIQNGVPADQAQVQTLSKMEAWGVPGASDKLAAAQEQLLKNKTQVAEASKDTSQGAAAQDEISNRGVERGERQQQLDLDTKKNTWQTVSDTPQTTIQQNGLGETKVVQKMQASQAAASAVTPDAMQAMLNSYHTTGTVPTGLSRSPALTGAFWQAESDYQKSSGNDAGAALAAKSAASANTKALGQTQQQLSSTTSYFQTMDKNIALANAQAAKLNLTDMPTLNRALAAWKTGTSDPEFAKYNVFFDSVANEYAKIKSGSLGNSPVSDSARKEAQGILLPLMGTSGVQAAFDAVKQEGQNRLDSLANQRDGLVQRITSAGKGPPQPAPAPAATPTPAPQAPAATSGGWGQVQKVG